MQAPVSMLKGLNGKASVSLVVGLLIGLALVVSLKKASASSATQKKTTL